MPERPSKAAINRLGERLKNGDESDETFAELDAYRALFDPMADELIPRIEAITGPVTRRIGKTTMSIVAKLRRLSIKLSQMQDIAGARIGVNSIEEQHEFFDLLREAFPTETTFHDKRYLYHLAEQGIERIISSPITTSRYRALHMIVKYNSLPFELQIRTHCQSIWAQISEDIAGQYGVDIKYGIGATDILEKLALFGDRWHLEEIEESDNAQYCNRHWEQVEALLDERLKRFGTWGDLLSELAGTEP